MTLSWGCEDYLEVEPETEPTSASFFQDEVKIERLLVSAYQPMRWERIARLGDSYSMPFYYTDARSDDNITENKLFQAHTHGFVIYPGNEYELDAGNVDVEAIWAKFFAGIAAANTIIQGVGSLGDDTSILSAEQKDAFIAEAKFLRAYYYFEAVKVFGDVPLFGDEPSDVTDIESLKRKPIAEVYAQIEEDLDIAEAGLPVDASDDAKYRATQGAAAGLLSKVYLYQEKWQDAADAAGRVLSLGKYSLESNFGDNFKIDNEFGSESVFEISYEYSPVGGTFDVSAASTLALQFFSPNLGADSPGWNYNLVTRELREAFANEGDVERREATLIEPGSVLGSEQLAAAGQDPVPTAPFEYINEEGDGGPRYGTDYVFSRKYFLTPEEVTAYSAGGFQESPLNHKVLRLAEIYLIIAEASINGATTGEISGQEAFDMVRERAGLESKALTYDALKLERRLELATEWNRFHDLIRWGDAASEIEDFEVGKDEFLPIPANDIRITGRDGNGDWILAQNNGY